MLECLKYSLNSMVLCYDLSLCGKISTILFGFFVMILYFTEICVCDVCGFTSLTRKGECCHCTCRNSIYAHWEVKGMRLNGLPTTESWFNVS